ncbi:MAG: ribonuclease Z [Nanoarchaeota archaeon]
MKITFLGTGAMLPTKERNPNAIFISYNSEGILIDCAEGTQRQLRYAGISPTKVTKLLITHWHGDHVLGIPGLLQSLGASNYMKKLEIYGPKGSKNFFKHMMNGLAFKSRIKYELKEINEGKFFDNDDFYLVSSKVKHSIDCLSYSLIEKNKLKININYTKKFGLTQHPLLGELQRGKDIVYNNKKIKVKDATIVKMGKKICFILDSYYDKKLISIAKDADLLISESTWLEKDKLQDKEHLSAKDAGKLAKQAKVKKLILTHFSQRYKDLNEMLKEAKKEFNDVELARDLMSLEV